LPLQNKGKRGKGHNITAFATLVEITQTHLVYIQSIAHAAKREVEG